MTVVKAATIGMLPDLSRKAAAMRGCAGLTQVQNFGLYKRVTLQYWHTWVRAMVALLCSVSSSVLPVRPPDWQT